MLLVGLGDWILYAQLYKYHVDIIGFVECGSGWKCSTYDEF